MNDNSSSAPPVIVRFDAHKESITFAVARCEGEVHSVVVLNRGEIRNAPNLIGNKVQRLQKEFGDHLHFVGEVVAPSRIPLPPSDRV